MARNTNDPLVGTDRSVLIQELEELRHSLHTHALRGGGARDRAWAVIFRLVEGLKADEWDQVARRFGFEDWQSLPLDDNLYPTLTRLQERMTRLAHLTDHDPLTGLANRRALERSLQIEMERTERFKTPLSLAMLDLDDFKKINDTHGHACGDAVLGEFARTLTDSIRKSDVAARYGGEEFALLLPGTGQTRSQQLMNRIQEALADMTVLCPGIETPVRVTSSIGVASTRGRISIAWPSFLQIADEALYQAKRQGKNRVVMAPLVDLPGGQDGTEVRLEEKKFLFSKEA